MPLKFQWTGQHLTLSLSNVLHTSAKILVRQIIFFFVFFLLSDQYFELTNYYSFLKNLEWYYVKIIYRSKPSPLALASRLSEFRSYGNCEQRQKRWTFLLHAPSDYGKVTFLPIFSLLNSVPIQKYIIKLFQQIQHRAFL